MVNKKFYYQAIILALLAGIFLLNQPVFLLIGFLLVVLTAIATFMMTFKVDKLIILVVVNYAYWLISGIVVGAMNENTFLSYKFWSEEGRIFLYYVPLLAFLIMRLPSRVHNYIIKLISFIAGTSLILLLIYVLSSGEYFTFKDTTVFVGTLTSHTGAGSFFGGVSIFLILYGVMCRKKKLTILGLLMILPTVATISRQAVVAMVGTMVWFMFSTRKIKELKRFRSYFIKISAILIIIILFAVSIFPHNIRRFSEMFSRDVYSTILQTMKYSDWEPGKRKAAGGIDWKYNNIQTRVLLWDYAVQKFISSPIVGIGMFRYNDTDLKFSGIPFLVYPATEGVLYHSAQIEMNPKETVILSPGNAHNSYLHILAETGVIGLALMFLLWKAMYMRLNRLFYSKDISLKAFSTANRGLLVYTLLGAFWGHALAAPSIGILVSTLTAVSLNAQRNGNRDNYLRMKDGTSS